MDSGNQSDIAKRYYNISSHQSFIVATISAATILVQTIFTMVCLCKGNLF